ncbi:MAG: hypothetical protein HGA44_05630 [Cellulomonadaceae bacterium]|nr:hypothetical protein [Cellulomonadaceae bacterium]
MLRATARLLATTVLALAGLTAALPADADDPTDATDEAAGITPAAVSQCLSGNICLWAGTSYSSTFKQTYLSSPQVGLTARSYKNASSVVAYLYSAAGGAGTRTCIPAGATSVSTYLAVASYGLGTSSSC